MTSFRSAKYPLAIIAKALDVFRDRWVCAFDVGCSFQATVQSSPKLAKRFKDSGSRICINAFHGYSHCYLCQLRYHPNIIEGSGLEDFETLERVFSSSNQLASTTRYASAFRRRLFIEAYFKQWDEDKYLSLGTFLFNNYKQALKIAEQGTIALADAQRSLGITDADMNTWEVEETTFFSQLGDEDSQYTHAIAYVELLQQLTDLADKRS